MASIFRRESRDGKKAAKYSIKYKDENGAWKTVAGCKDVESTRKLAGKLESDATLRRNGVAVEFSKAKVAVPFDAFELYLTAKGDTRDHIEQTIDKVRKTFEACSFETLSDLRNSEASSKVAEFLLHKKRDAKRKPTAQLSKRVVYSEAENRPTISARTRNAYVAAIKTFCKWCVKTGPFVRLQIDIRIGSR